MLNLDGYKSCIVTADCAAGYAVTGGLSFHTAEQTRSVCRGHHSGESTCSAQPLNALTCTSASHMHPIGLRQAFQWQNVS